MKALFLVHNHPNRGSWFRALEIARRVAKRGHEVQFAFTSELQKYRPHYIPKYESPSPGEHKDCPAYFGSRSDLKRLGTGMGIGNLVMAEMPYRTLFNERQEGWSLFDNAARVRDALSERWDLIYGFSHKPNCVLPQLAGKLRGARLILDWSDWWGTDEGLYRKCVLPSQGFQALPLPIRMGRRAVFALESWWEPLAYGLPDAVTLISEEFLSHPRAPKALGSRSLVMHSGSDLESITPMDKHEARMAIGLELPPGAVVFGYIANFHMAERLLLDAFARVCANEPNAVLLVVGAGLEKSDPQIHSVTSGRIRHFGWQPFEKVGQFLGASNALLLPLNDIALDRARYPHKLSDYVASGRPIVACDVGETGRLLRRYGIGRLCDPNAEAFSAAMLAEINDRSAWETVGREVRAAAETHFDWDRLFSTWSDFVRDRTSLAI